MSLLLIRPQRLQQIVLLVLHLIGVRLSVPSRNTTRTIAGPKYLISFYHDIQHMSSIRVHIFYTLVLMIHDLIFHINVLVDIISTHLVSFSAISLLIVNIYFFSITEVRIVISIQLFICVCVRMRVRVHVYFR